MCSKVKFSSSITVPLPRQFNDLSRATHFTSAPTLPEIHLLSCLERFPLSPHSALSLPASTARYYSDVHF